jgi:hypothetical protein
VYEDDADVAGARAAILGYLAANANAADTREGIGNWWLPIQYRAMRREIIERALDALVADGLIKATALLDGTLLYRRGDAFGRG